MPLSFAPGEAYQFDRSHEVVLINGATVTIKVAHKGQADGNPVTFTKRRESR